MPLPCSLDSCPYTTEAVAETLADMLKLLEIHASTCHPSTAPAVTPTRHTQAERVKRPILNLSGQALEQEDYEHFLYMFAQYKSRLGEGQDGATLLRECLGTDVSKVLYSNFGADLSTFTEEDIKSSITRHCVTQQTSQARATELHRLKQEPGQSVSTFLATLKAKARQCDLKTECVNCHNMADFSEKTLLTLFLRGLSDTELQQDLLAEQDLSLEKCLRIATARETAKRSQETFNTTSQAVEGISAYKEEQKRIKIPPDCCKYCGNKKHSDKNSCPAKDTVCTCGKTGHYRHLCFSRGRKPKAPKPKETKEKTDEAAETGNFLSASCFNIQTESPLPASGESSPQVKAQVIPQPEEVTLASLVFDKSSKKWKAKPCDESSNQLHVLIKPQLEHWAQLHPTPADIPDKTRTKQTKSAGLADTGASVVCSGTSTMRQMGLEEKHLCPTTTVIRVASKEKLTVLGFIPVAVQVVGHPDKQTVQALYITKELTSLFISRTCLLELGCLPQSWPYPQVQPEKCAANTAELLAPCGCPVRTETPKPPTELPFPATDANGPRLKEWLLNYYSSSTFNTCPHQKLPCMAGPPLKLAIKPDATPTCHVKPYGVPLHWRKEIEDGLARDINMGIIERLPANTPAIWCHRMVVTTKPGSPKPRRTVDMSALKEASYRLTHPGAPPFLEAQSIPAGSYKTVTDAWQGFHMIPLDPESMPYTNFVTEWGMFRYKRMPMGDHVSMDAYNYRFDKVTEKVENLNRCVDDSLLNSDTLENAFFQAANYLSLLGQNGILQNPDKFQFGSKTVEWAGFTISENNVKPLAKHTAAIRSFPTPLNITDLRSFMALLQQVSYCYAISPATTPLRHLLKPAEKWRWTEDINKVFEEARDVIANKVEEGVRLFDPKLPTGLLSDWCQEGIGHILCQKHCDCTAENDLNCCPTGWPVCSVGSRFCNTAESNYSPTDGEFTALVDALEKTSHFTLGCKSLTVGTDHMPLLPIIHSTNLGEIKTPRQQRLKERLMRWNLIATYVPGKHLGGTDALSRYGIRAHNDETVNDINWGELSPDISEEARKDEETHKALHSLLADQDSPPGDWGEHSLFSLNMSHPPVTSADIVMATDKDASLTKLRLLIHKGFPGSKSELLPCIQPYWRVRDMLTEHQGVIYMGDRVVLPHMLRDRVLSTLHSAHQGTTSMRLRAERSMFWPNMATDIADMRNSCTSCDAAFPSQSAEPPITPSSPEYPFQHVCSDYFSVSGHNFCLVVDRFSNWLQVFTGKGGSHNLTSLLGQTFHSFGIPESLTSDGGPQYIAEETQEFLRKLGIHHRKSSVGFPHANQKAERSVGAAKRVIRDAVKISGELDTVTLIKGLLQLRNTPDPDTGMSPAQMLLGRQLRDFIPGKPAASITSNKDFADVWTSVANWREKALAPRSVKLHDRLSQKTKELPPLQEGDYVLLQNLLGNHPKRWDKRGVVVQADTVHRQYKVMTFGSRRLTLRNRRHLRKFTPAHIPAGAPTGISRQTANHPKPVQNRPAPAKGIRDYQLPASPMEHTRARGELFPGPGQQPQQADLQPDRTGQLDYQTPGGSTVPTNMMDRPTYHPTLTPLQPAEHSAEQFQQPQQSPSEQPSQQFQQFQQPAPAMQVMQPVSPALLPALRRSARSTRGQTDKFKDFVQYIGPAQQNLPEPCYQCSPYHGMPTYTDPYQPQLTHLPLPRYPTQQAAYQIQCQPPMMNWSMMNQPMMNQPMMNQPMMNQPMMMCYIMADGHN